jgi:hypothetical protein
MGDLPPEGSVPFPCVAQVDVHVECTDSPEEYGTPAITVVGHRMSATRRRSRVRLLSPRYAVLLPRVGDGHSADGHSAKEYSPLPVTVVGEGVTCSPGRSAIGQLGPGLPVPRPGIRKDGGR